VSPFGGFYASAIKRTYGLKDFDSVIPGHGGVMDRMDCQFITALFTTVYYNTFIRYVRLSSAFQDPWRPTHPCCVLFRTARSRRRSR
jgi:hypothetical protein